MSKRTVRTLRTVIQVVLALASAVPDVVAGLPVGAAAAQAVAVAALVTHYFQVIEALPGFPKALKVPVPK